MVPSQELGIGMVSLKGYTGLSRVRSKGYVMHCLGLGM